MAVTCAAPTSIRRWALLGTLLLVLQLALTAAGIQYPVFRSAAAASDDGPFIVVDQFGYLPRLSKVAVLRDPREGQDADQVYTPAGRLELVNVDTGQVVLRAAATAWQDGTTDSSSGDRVWRFDFSRITAPGQYKVRDRVNDIESPIFQISDYVWRDVLTQAFRTFYYQRAGFTKRVPFADGRWADAASHLKPLQDTQARLYSARNDASTQRNLRGGWYDAGDFNKYTNWTADYVISLLHSYLANPDVWTDDFNIPESGNGRADLLDEVRWGLIWLARMQQAGGSVLSIVSLDTASPPSAAQGQSVYGPASTSATLSASAAFALGSIVFESVGEQSYAQNLARRARVAWQWSVANPAVRFFNNDSQAGTEGVGAGQQEVDAYGLSMKWLAAAIYLNARTGAEEYRNEAESRLQQSRMISGRYVNPWEQTVARDLLYYASLPTTQVSTADLVRQRFTESMNSARQWGAVDSDVDAYRAYIEAYTWGSNSTKARQGLLFSLLKQYKLGNRSTRQIEKAAAGYLHYLHGVNPLGLVYLSNMNEWGAERSVDTFYHSWFADDSARWDSVSGSQYGPAPGFLVGGPNPSYTWADCCPGSCGAIANAQCGVSSLVAGQPAQKAYAEFNDSWPLMSWQITENSNGYQVAYLDLLARFVVP